ncbi:ATP-dependent RNA helicase SUV3 [Sodiomyces alkalinus F11]|uniref:ATP-dependent RNA helicase SUV3, mitochondrial n=1 Tax=Sodiomyces alkalinus (strain CBS 110278 / VKM F-3762 / F11) TaxID=1314773 RepID=A0A3N2Q4Z5_SODAK|nr:ATP-dependent RNA helicase SUV3 [Sodiomyces alkalinus F11]ROT41840.1 ATP-dependent RNA helicase SUV3 [Sodiomyces alkalinus F11]
MASRQAPPCCLVAGQPLANSGPRNARKKKYEVFKSMVNTQFNKVVDEMSSSDIRQGLKGFGIRSGHALANEVVLFRKTIAQAMAMAERGNDNRNTNPLFWALRNAFIRGDVKGLASEIRYSFQSFMIRARLTGAVGKSQKQLADFRYPMEWFPATRAMQRTIHLHVGPTNSGKTYHALKALESANSGIYGGPLRLLAQEIYARFQAKGKPCAMVTGEEQRIPQDADNYFISCTVEMTPLNRVVEVAVLDEIQMIGDPDRGWAWTQALLGVMAKEVHLCGEERAVNLIQSVCAAIGDKCIVHRYKRLSPLETMNESLNNDLKNLRKGDAVIAFSRVNLHGLKKAIEEETGRRCAIVYGSLPPETRAQQAALFNDPDNDYDFLVASDAVGMGLNLEIKRVVFETVTKFDGTNVRRLTTSETKQIGGRAGRFKTAREAAQGDGSALDVGKDPADGKMGYVTTLDQLDLEAVREAFESGIEPLEAAYISPPAFILERFSEYLPPDVPLSFMLLRIRELARVSPMFLVEVSPDALAMADAIQSYPLTIHERLAMMNAPVQLREPGMPALVQAMARCLATRKGGALCDLKEVDLEMLDKTLDDYGGNGRDYLRHVESLHHAITLYLWMSYRFANVFVSQKLAFHVKDLVQAKIEQYLDTSVSFRTDKHEMLRDVRRREALKREREQQRIFGKSATAAAEAVAEQGPGRWNEPGHEEPLVEEAREYEELDDGGSGSR